MGRVAVGSGRRVWRGHFSGHCKSGLLQAGAIVRVVLRSRLSYVCWRSRSACDFRSACGSSVIPLNAIFCCFRSHAKFTFSTRRIRRSAFFAGIMHVAITLYATREHHGKNLSRRQRLEGMRFPPVSGHWGEPWIFRRSVSAGQREKPTFGCWFQAVKRGACMWRGDQRWLAPPTC